MLLNSISICFRVWALSILGSRRWPFRVTWCHRSRDIRYPIGHFLFASSEFFGKTHRLATTHTSHSLMNISETVRDRGLVTKDHQIGNGWHRESNGHVTDDVTWFTPINETRDPNVRAHYLGNSWRCYLETITNYSAVMQYGRLS